MTPNRRGLSPYLACVDAAAAIDLYTRALGATETTRLVQPDGRIGHAELEVHGTTVMLADEFPEIDFASPRARGGSSVFLHLEVPDVDRVFEQATAAGMTALSPPLDDQGGRRARLRDPSGHVWLIGTSAPDDDAELARLWDLADLITPMALRVAATLRLADHIEEGDGAIASLAARAGADASALLRLLRYLTARGVFAEPEPGRFALLPPARLLRDGHRAATRRWLDLAGFGGMMDLAFFDLLGTVRSGRPPRDGGKGQLSAELAASYDDVMEAQSRRDAPAVVAAFDFTRFAHIVDVGGGTGQLLAEILAAHPGARGTLLELPATAARARPTDRARVVAGDLFEVLPEGGDLYVVKLVLHSLEDAEAVRALSRMRQAAAPGGRVLVIERTVGSDGDRTLFTAMDLRMLILGHGRERTLDEYTALAAGAGLSLASVRTTPMGLHLIELA